MVGSPNINFNLGPIGYNRKTRFDKVGHFG